MSKPAKTVTLTKLQYDRLHDGVSGVAEIAHLCQELATEYVICRPGH
jgi:hypothetical protein